MLKSTLQQADKAAIKEVVVVFFLVEDVDNKEEQRWQQGEAAIARRCNDRGVVESGCGSEGNKGKGGGSSVVRSISGCKQLLRMR
ncbi:hypothetical protein BHE74_00004699 [Ensete ventricosum]|nr:hypothetical protein BHE74_00004699 [Ensete ventricosum]